jgi:hypothetical protein
MWLFKQIKQEPVLFQGLIQALFPVLVAFGVLQLQDSQLGTLYAFTAALLSFLTRIQVTPLSNPRNEAGNRLVPRPSSDS